MVPLYVVIAVVPEPGGGLLQVFYVPVVLVQRVVYQGFVLKLHANPQQEVRRHEQGVRPGLLREVVAGGDRVLQYPLAEAQGLILQVVHLAHDDIQVLFLPGMLIQRQAAVAHGAGVHRPVREPQLRILVHPGPDHVQILLLPGGLIGTAYPVIGHSAGPVPGHVHAHGARHYCVYCFLYAAVVKGQVHNILSPVFYLKRVRSLFKKAHPNSKPFQNIMQP